MARSTVVVISLLTANVAHAKPFVATKDVPGLGCFARSGHGDAIACVIGTAGTNVGGSQETVVFARVTGEPPEPIPLFTETDEVSRGPDALPASVVAALARALRGYAVIEHAAGTIDVTDGKATPPVTIGGARIAVAVTSVPPVGFAPGYHTVLTVARAGTPAVTLDDRTASTSGLTISVYPLGKAVIIEEIASVADEGTYGSTAEVWRCVGVVCDPL